MELECVAVNTLTDVHHIEFPLSVVVHIIVFPVQLLLMFSPSSEDFLQHNTAAPVTGSCRHTVLGWPKNKKGSCARLFLQVLERLAKHQECFCLNCKRRIAIEISGGDDRTKSFVSLILANVSGNQVIMMEGALVGMQLCLCTTAI